MERLARAISAYRKAIGEKPGENPPDETMVSLLADMMLWASGQGLDWYHLTKRARAIARMEEGMELAEPRTARSDVTGWIQDMRDVGRWDGE